MLEMVIGHIKAKWKIQSWPQISTWICFLRNSQLLEILHMFPGTCYACNLCDTFVKMRCYDKVTQIWFMIYVLNVYRYVITLRLRRNCRHFAEDIFKCVFLNENLLILIDISLKFVPKGWINNIPVLVQICHLDGTKPLSEPMIVRLLMYIYASLHLYELEHGYTWLIGSWEMWR